jgi:endonuclease-3
MAKKMTVPTEFIRAEITKLFPEARCELHYSTNLELLIAIILSAQTTDESVNKTTPNLFRKYHTVSDYAEAPLQDIEEAIRHLGLYKNKAAFIQKTCILLRDRFNGVIPASQEDLEKLPGVGRKTANVYLSEWHHLPRIAVDTHVSRVSVRLGLAEENDSPEQIEQKLMKQFPEKDWIDTHHKFIFFGRYFCTAKRPNCHQCPLLSICKKPLL